MTSIQREMTNVIANGKIAEHWANMELLRHPTVDASCAQAVFRLLPDRIRAILFLRQKLERVYRHGI